jgi:hypothetical protein
VVRIHPRLFGALGTADEEGMKGRRSMKEDFPDPRSLRRSLDPGVFWLWKKPEREEHEGRLKGMKGPERVMRAGENQQQTLSPWLAAQPGQQY